MLFVAFPLLLLVILLDFNFHQFDQHVSPWLYPVQDALCFLGLGGYFLSIVWEVFNCNLFKYFLRPFLFLFFFCCCCCSVTKSRPALCNPMDYSTPGLLVFHYLLELLKLMSIELVMPSNHLILCLSLLLLPSIFPRIRVF